MSEALVSVIIPVYGAEKYILESLKSVCNQTYNNIEIIIVDDGSKDRSIKIVEDFMNRHTAKIRLISQENKGVPAARNTGIRNANGKYICFIDSDDIIEKHHISSLVKILEKYNLQMAFTDFQNTTMGNRWGTGCDDRINSKIINKPDIQKLFLLRKIKIHACALMLSRNELLDRKLWFNEKLKFGEDVEFIWRWLDSIDSIAYVKRASYKYLCRPGSLMTSQNTDRIQVFFNEFTNTICNLKMDNQLKKMVISRVSLGIFHSFAKNSDYSLFRNLLLKTKANKLTQDAYLLDDIQVNCLRFLLIKCPIVFWVVSKAV